VIGINTAIIQNAQNIGFAISVGLARPIVEQRIEEGSIDRAYVGISTVDVNSAIAANLDLPVDAGVIVEFVAADTPADAAGLQRGDVIVQVDGEDINNKATCCACLRNGNPMTP
jgi:serine protease Do